LAGLISEIIPGSIAEGLKLAAGDLVLTINGKAPMDMIDYQYLTTDRFVKLEIEKADGRKKAYLVKKAYDEDLGIVFTVNVFDRIRECANKCLFCFVRQMPEGCRSSLYVRDDDYRMSFMQGNFITGTNLSQKDLQRIKERKLSPLYFSVHTTDPAQREYLLQNKRAGNILPLLQDLVENGIQLHTQIVLCPGINDGVYLERTIRDLSALFPGVESVAVVPVGLTKFQVHEELRCFTKEECGQVLDYLEAQQNLFLRKFGTRFIFPSDEFYIAAGREIPSDETYEEFAHLENGVGLTRYLHTSFDLSWPDYADIVLEKPRHVTIVTGKSGYPAIFPLVEKMNTIENLQIDIITAENRFFGPSVTVTGLLTGSCLLAALTDWRELQSDRFPIVFISQSMLKFETDLFLDDMTVAQIEERLNIKLIPIDLNGEEFICKILGIDPMV
jgi:putative radical SAM enzyme (TIGR03279 family)